MHNKPTSHSEALKSTAIIGGSTAIVMLIRIVRTKVMAILLGPAGIGLEAIYESVQCFSRAIADLGISTSGVRQIATAVGSGDSRAVAVTVTTLRRVCMLFGAAGALGLFLIREQVSCWVFGNADHAFDIGLLSAGVFLAGVMGGQAALLQGMRRIGDLARMNILGALTGAVLSIPIVYFWGQAGIPAYLVMTAVVGVVVSWTYARKVRVESVRIPFRRALDETAGLLKLGLVFLLSGLMTTAAMFLMRVLVTREQGIDGAGLFQAANSLSLVYVGFVLQAMGTDFYPRLTVVADDDHRCNQLVNEQAEVSLVLALPGVLATLALAPWVIRFFYSGKFEAAAGILSWQVAGMFLRVNSWPMGFILLAKGRALALFLTDLAAYSVYIGLGWAGLQVFGLSGTGMAFLGLYIFHWIMMFLVVRRVSGFSWTPANVRLSLMGMGAVALALGARQALPEPWSTLAGCALAAAAGLYCLRAVSRMTGNEKVLSYVKKISRFFPPWGLPRLEQAANLAQKEGGADSRATL